MPSGKMRALALPDLWSDGSDRETVLARAARAGRLVGERAPHDERMVVVGRAGARWGRRCHSRGRWEWVEGVEVRFLPSGVLQRVSSGSEARGRSVRSVRQTWIRWVTGERTREAMRPEALDPTRA